jgi:hypothetical protein
MRYLSTAALLSILAGLALVAVGSTVAAEEKAWGTVKGTIVFEPAALPSERKVNVDKEQGHCLSKGPIFSEEWVINKENRGVRWTFVWLAPKADGETLPIHPSLAEPKEKEVVMDQPCCKFEPHAMALRKGQVWVVKNSAPVPHNVNYTGGRLNPGNNLSMPPGGQVKVSDLNPSHLPVQVKCNIHGWMTGWVRIFDHPYHAITDEKGNFEIKNAPVGEYRLVVWHEGAGWGPGFRAGNPITIKADGATELGKIGIKPADE